MEYSKLGNSDLLVSRICMGCMGFGNAATSQHSWTVAVSYTHLAEVIDYLNAKGEKVGIVKVRLYLSLIHI